MQLKETEILYLKKLRKDGSLPEEAIAAISQALRANALVLLPVDNIYAIAAVASGENEKRISRVVRNPRKRYVRLISSFRMLDDIAVLTKNDYDFLNRIWPDEITVIMKKKDATRESETVGVRFPRSRFLQSVIARVDRPLVFSHLYRGLSKSALYKKGDLEKACRGLVAKAVIVEELCKKHPPATIIDISGSTISIMRAGRVSVEEIKSLFFLRKTEDEES
ncbi:MAG: Sua5/YciO/YrdC/YwlC family protein [Spirochaetota bacterium]|nr:Sua5/YciO/YrdC/YwlC family protein [Spirochaetota bacterium]OPZ38187.1 MAG: yrdC domain protein [Spirochaetes bacterium ADurb.BinA120]